MTTKRDNSDDMGDLFGGKVAAPAIGQVQATNAKRRNFIRGVTITENNAWHRIRAHWIKVFADAPGVPRVQDEARNQRKVIKCLREAAADPDFRYIDEEIICQAISFYRFDPDNVKFTRWKKFSDWMGVESVDKYRAKFKATNPEQLQAAQAKARRATQVAEAAKLVKHMLSDAAVWAAEKRMSTRDYLIKSMNSPKLHSSLRDFYESMLPIVDWRSRLQGAPKIYLSNLAARVFVIHFDRPAGECDKDFAQLEGIELAYLALHPTDPKLREGQR